MIEKRDLYLVILAAVLVINVVIGVHYYDVGRRKVALVATQDSLTHVQREKAIISKQRDSIGVLLKAKGEQTEKTRVVYRQSQPVIKGDSAFTQSGEFVQVLDHRVTEALVSGQEHISSLESELATAKFALKVDTVFIAKDSQELGLHRSIEKLTSAPRISRGLQVGVGYCRNQTGGTACLYAGYGFSVRF